MKKAAKPKYYIRSRQWQDSTFRTAWIIRTDGAVEAGLLWGEVLPQVVQELAAATGLEVVEENVPLATAPYTPPGCVPVAKQQSLFPE